MLAHAPVQYFWCFIFEGNKCFLSCLVIGRGGEQISRLQQESGCKIQIAPGRFTFAADVVDVSNATACWLLLISPFFIVL